MNKIVILIVTCFAALGACLSEQVRRHCIDFKVLTYPKKNHGKGGNVFLQANCRIPAPDPLDGAKWEKQSVDLDGCLAYNTSSQFHVFEHRINGNAFEGNICNECRYNLKWIQQHDYDFRCTCVSKYAGNQRVRVSGRVEDALHFENGELQCRPD
ncbi:hypothetical protein BDV25DRAFT_138754 [Aspergillus avenaceus]|uniref:Cyanovirin-N domain-containing protein n=1 Tax=Aspergillus avenaceus TaxID=36643 RepID=A0A5N6TZJ5_ASPAV|nr:hypothetical protein BDV25DRAFT_138754 [Aspergillus avenaceus]